MYLKLYASESKENDLIMLQLAKKEAYNVKHTRNYFYLRPNENQIHTIKGHKFNLRLSRNRTDLAVCPIEALNKKATTDHVRIPNVLKMHDDELPLLIEIFYHVRKIEGLKNYRYWNRFLVTQNGINYEAGVFLPNQYNKKIVNIARQE
jgi:hypothetical protein